MRTESGARQLHIVPRVVAQDFDGIRVETRVDGVFLKRGAEAREIGVLFLGPGSHHVVFFGPRTDHVSQTAGDAEDSREDASQDFVSLFGLRASLNAHRKIASLRASSGLSKPACWPSKTSAE